MDKHVTPDRYVGIDVGKDRIEVRIRPDAIAFGCDTDAQGLEHPVTRLKPLQPKVIALEATGGYETIIVATLSNAGPPVAIVNPRQTRQFAGALGRLAKTDRIDAGVIAHFAEMAKLEGKPPADAQFTELRALLARRSQLVEMARAERQRGTGGKPAHPPVVPEEGASAGGGNRAGGTGDRRADQRQSVGSRRGDVVEDHSGCWRCRGADLHRGVAGTRERRSP